MSSVCGCQPDSTPKGKTDRIIAQDEPLTALPSYRKAKFKADHDQGIHRILLAFEKEEEALSGMGLKPEQRSEQDIASAVGRCKKLQSELDNCLSKTSGERLASHLAAMLSDRPDACFYEIYLLEVLGRLTGIEYEKRVRLQEGEARQLFSKLLSKVQSAKQKWTGDLRWMYLTLCVELAQEHYRDHEPSHPPFPTADDPNWDQKTDRFFDWLRQTLEGK